MSKEEWKESGTELGHAFKNFGKTFIRSAETATDKVVEWADDVTKKEEDREKDIVQEQPGSTVFSDGSWKKVGKDLGKGFAGIGKSLLHTAGIGEEEDKK